MLSGNHTKGLHAVALEVGRYRAHFAIEGISDQVHWCVNTVQATVIAVDSPCGWSLDGRGRPAELALMKERIWCFSTPCEAVAVAHAKGYFYWMRQGMALYAALAPTHPLRDPRTSVGQRYCFETFPHAC